MTDMFPPAAYRWAGGNVGYSDKARPAVIAGTKISVLCSMYDNGILLKRDKRLQMNKYGICDKIKQGGVL